MSCEYDAYTLRCERCGGAVLLTVGNGEILVGSDFEHAWEDHEQYHYEQSRTIGDQQWPNNPGATGQHKPFSQ